jgi:ATP-dependent Clp protease, protease subunit
MLIDLPQKTSLKVINKADDTAEILLYGAIGENPWDPDSISAKAFADELKKLSQKVKNIDLRVNSGGGSVFEGMTIFQRLKDHQAKVTAYVDGFAASIASIIIMAADEIIMGEGSMLMIHKPLVMTYGNAEEHERMIDILDKIESQMISIYAKKTGMSRAEIATALAKETWYTAEQAVENNLATKIMASADNLRIAATMGSQLDKYPWLRNAPKIKNQDDIIREKLREFNNKAKDYFKAR